VLPRSTLERMVQAAFPRVQVSDVESLHGGLRNTNLKLRIESLAGPIVLRVYRHDPMLCQKELDLLRMVARAVPVPEVIHAEPRGIEELPPFALMRFLEGIPFRELKRSGDAAAIAQAAFSAGETLAAIGRFKFDKAGWIAPGPSVTWALPDGFVDSCLESPNLQRRMTAELRKRTRGLTSAISSLPEEMRLVHCDFSRRNVLVRPGDARWRVAAVLDWEFAVSGSRLADIANFLRYDLQSRPVAEPHFSAGYASAGGDLPDEWRYLTKLVDLVALCEMLTRDELPDGVATELVELVRATVEHRDPQLG